MKKVILVKGRVQGVGFRHYIMTKARKQDLGGSVENLPDGSVRIICEEKDLKTFLDLAQKGNGFSRVDEVETFDGEGLVPTPFKVVR